MDEAHIGEMERVAEAAADCVMRQWGMNPGEKRVPMPKNVAAALVIAQAAVVKVPHDGHNKHHDYRYTTAEAVIEAAREPMAKAGLSFSSFAGKLTPPTKITWWEQGADGPVEVVDTLPASIEVRGILAHESGETWETPPMHVPVIPEKGRPWDKAIATASTYALGYSLRGLLKMPRTDEADDLDRRNDANTERGTKAAKAPAKKADPLPAIKAALDELPNEDEPTLQVWINKYGARAVAAVGMEKAQELVQAAATRLGVPTSEAESLLLAVKR